MRTPAFTPVGPVPADGWREDPRDFRLVATLPGVLDGAECDALVALASELGQAEGAIGTEDGHTEVDATVRRVRQTPIRAAPETAWVHERLAAAIDACNLASFGYELDDFDGDLLVVDYREGDFYEWHLDVGAGATSRKLSVSLMLSAPEEYEGGSLAFPGEEHAAVPRGDAIVFASFLLHGVRPVKQGRRRALLAWVAGPPFR